MLSCNIQYKMIEMTQIAIYGKGGIGKSTISANLSAALAKRGKKVLQIGCDPKHDSTRLLLEGTAIPTVVNYLRQTTPDNRYLKDILFRGYKDVACVEAGGPEPGVGCAGRGILSTFELLGELGIDKIPFDITLYDVLGDVVCGGFAVPLRKEYADAVYLVTSGEYMALYAANNILRGIKSFGTSAPGVAGIIHNGRGLEHEDRRVQAFAKAVNLPIIVSIPRSECFAQAEKEGKTLAELYPDSAAGKLFLELSDHVEDLGRGSTGTWPATPLSDVEMEELVLGHTENTKPTPYISPATTAGLKKEVGPDRPSRGHYTKSIRNKQPLQGCSFAGAATIITQLNDVLTIAHGPRSCAHIVSNFLQKTAINAAVRYGSHITPRSVLLPTDMGDNSFIFGGNEDLRKNINTAADHGWKNIIIITTCPSGLIGDNIKQVIEDSKKQYPGLNILYLPVDGNLAGDFSQGMIEGYRKVLELVDRDVLPEDGLVNIIGEKNLSDNITSNFQTIKKLLDVLDLKINCRLIANSSLNDLINFKRAGLNLLAHNDGSGSLIKELVKNELDVNFFSLPFPTGFNETARWVRELGGLYGKEKDAEVLIETEKVLYEQEMNHLRPILEGRTVLISAFSLNLDWIIDTILDAGMKVEKIGLAVSPEAVDFNSRYAHSIPVEFEYTSARRVEDIEELRPDLVLSNYPPVISAHPTHHDAIPFSQDAGFHTGLLMAQKWSRILRLPVVEGWKLEMEEME